MTPSADRSIAPRPPPFFDFSSELREGLSTTTVVVSAEDVRSKCESKIIIIITS